MKDFIDYNAISFKKIRSVKTPEREWLNSWIDFFIPDNVWELFEAENCKFTPSQCIPEENQKKMKYSYFIVEENRIEIPPGHWLLIPSGIKMQLPLTPEGSALDLVLYNKSWVSTKQWLDIGACVIDNNYRWEIHFHMVNTTPYIISVNAWQKITQWILRYVYFREINEVSEIDTKTERGEGWFGSTWV